MKNHSGVLQGQEDRENKAVDIKELGAPKPPLLPYLVSHPNPDWGYMQIGLENKLHLPIRDQFYPCSNSTVSLSGGSIVNSCLPNHWPAPYAPYGVRDNAALGRDFSVPNASSLSSGSQEWRTLELKDENGTPHAEPKGGSRYMLFGVNLINSSPELPSPQVATSNELESLCSVPPTSQSSVSETIQVSELSKSVSGIPSEKQCKNCGVSRSCTKVV